MSDSADDLHVRPGRIRQSRSGRAPQSFVGQVLKAANKAGGVSARGRLGRARGFDLLAEAAGAPRVSPALRGLTSRPGIVVVKARVVRNRAKATPLATHPSYLRRDGVTRDGALGEISHDYISRGLRARAEKHVTLELGPPSEQEIRQSLERRPLDAARLGASARIREE